MAEVKDKKVLNWFILFILALVWGSSFILMKRGLLTFNGAQVGAIRIFVAFLFMLPLAYRHIKKEHLTHWKAFLGMGACGNLIPAFLFATAETGISSALTGMLNSLTPLFTIITGLLFYKAKARWQSVAGVLTGLVGAIGLIASGPSSGPSSQILYSLLVVAATILYAFSVNIIGTHLRNVNAITATVWALMLTGPVAGAYLFSTDFVHILATNPEALKALGFVSILGIFGTALSVIVFNILIRNSNPVFASSVTYLIPVVAMFWGLSDGEAITYMHIICMVIILAGVWLVNRK
ncbi:MAG: DMT family transporter [Bacteroidia bacterium]